MAFIGIDLGTSFVKGAVLDADTLRIDKIQRVAFPEPLPGLPPLHREFDPAIVLDATRRLLGPLLAAAEPCEGLVMCSQMHGLVLTDSHGEPHSTLTTWQDQRVTEPHPSGEGRYVDVLLSRLSPDEQRQLGNETRPGQPAGVLFWLAEQGRAPSADLTLAALPDFVLANLCDTQACTESTNAMSHGVFNLETMDWHWEVIRKLGLDGLRWPAIVSHGAVVGYLRHEGRSIPCYTPVGDFQCALAGTLLRRGELSLNISTGSQVSLFKPGLEFGDFQTRPFFDGRFLASITHIPAGRALTDLVALFSELAVAQGLDLGDPWPYIVGRAREVGPTRMRADLAFFNSSVGDHGEFVDVREEELTVGHIFRAALQNMTDNYQRCAHRLITASDPAPAWSNLVFSGGLAQKIELLRELVVERFGVWYRVCPTAEDTMLGLMALALAFSGRTATVEEAMMKIYAANGGDAMIRPA